jgi:hypothetical protein
MDVLGAAAYACDSKKDSKYSHMYVPFYLTDHTVAFVGLWRRLKPAGKPEDGVPFAEDDPIFYHNNKSSAASTPVPSELSPAQVFDRDEDQHREKKQVSIYITFLVRKCLILETLQGENIVFAP